MKTNGEETMMDAREIREAIALWAEEAQPDENIWEMFKDGEIPVEDPTQEYGYRWESFADIPGVGRVERVASYGGEGDGDDYWVVISVTSDSGTKKLYRMDGYYASYNGGELDGVLYEVTPQEKTITVYERSQ